jgi:hypothetical protein
MKRKSKTIKKQKHLNYHLVVSVPPFVMDLNRYALFKIGIHTNRAP